MCVGAVMLLLDPTSFEEESLVNARPLDPRAGSPDRVDALDQISKRVLENSQARQFPDLATFGFFCRRSNVTRYLRSIGGNGYRVGLGTVLHVAPANIPMNFAFSFAMGFLAGNRNLVRVPSKSFPQAELGMEIIESALAEFKDADFTESSIFFRSSRESPRLAELRKVADGLVVWGGDETVQAFRLMPKKPMAREVYFSSRTSACAFRAREVLALNEKGLSSLVRAFYNDTYLVDQNACSSPSAVFWLGCEEEVSRAKARFWPEVASKAVLEAGPESMLGIAKLHDLFHAAASIGSLGRISPTGDILWTTEDEVHLQTGLRYGFFWEKEIQELSDIGSYCRETEQTLTYFGFTKEEIESCVFSTLSEYFERACPVGQALDMGFIWDGKDSLPLLSRRIEIA